jgi:hypothetical protein
MQFAFSQAVGELEVANAATITPIQSNATSVGALWPGLAGVAAVAFGASLVFWRRRARPANGTLMDAEAALVDGRPWAAHRRARRILRKDPSNDDAAFLFAASLIRQGKNVAAIGWMVPRLDEVRSSQARRTMCFLLAVAHAKQGQHEQAAAWARKAAQDRQLLARLRSDSIFAPLWRGGHLKGLAAGNEPGAAYA